MNSLEQRLRDACRADGIEKIVVGAIVHRGNCVLVLRRAEGDFMAGIEELPSGTVESGEPFLHALARELVEEAGLTYTGAADADFVSSFDYTSSSGKPTRQHTFAVALPRQDGDIQLSSEHTSYRWIDPDELGDFDLTDESEQTIRTWLATRHARA